jgi:A/G-specific adenine glycosylase
MMNERPEGVLEHAQVLLFRRRLMHWFRTSARELPWRGVREPYRTWVSEIMLQQTQVAAVLGHYERFMTLFPTVVALALAPEADVLAAWSGLGYYRRARMLHRAAQFLVEERGGRIPETAAELRTLPGIGEYTCAAIASISFGESVAVLDGNVERVLLRVAGRAEDSSAEGRAFLRTFAGALIPNKRIGQGTNATGDHNEAMMELGATICVPRGPLCLECPVSDLCRTRGEHVSLPRGKQKSADLAYLLATRKAGTTTEVLLARRDLEASLMPGMLELPPLPLDAVAGREPILRVRHSITTTNYYVAVYAEAVGAELRNAVPLSAEALRWEAVQRLHAKPLTGLARKVLMRANLWSIAGPETPETDLARGRATGKAG